MSNSLNNASTNLLAQYLAREQLTVVHNATAQTASIDLANRVLELPTWDTSKVGAQAKPVYHGLVGHEVAHALHTPADQWLSAQTEIAGANSSTHARAVAQDFVNVVEDARIEKIIKREFPGLKSDFAHMYDTMWKMDAFGCKGKDLSTMRFIDRLNLHFKVGIHAGVAVPFSDEEQEIVKRIERTVTFRDVIDIAKDLYNTAKQEEEDQHDQQGEEGQQGQPGDKQDGKNGKKPEPCNKGDKGESSKSDGQSDDSQDGDDSQSDGDQSQDGDQENKSEGNGNGDAQDGEGNKDGKDGEVDGKADGQSEDGKPEGKSKRSVSVSADTVPTGCATQQNLSKFVGGLVNVKIDEEPIRVPNIDPTDIIVDCDQFVNLVNTTAHAYQYAADKNTMNIQREVEEQSAGLFAEMTKRQKAAVDLMVRQFEMRKAAKDFARQSSCKTGRISPRHLAKYKFSEDIFDRVTVKRDEKNHGIVILLDWSGSMSVIIAEVTSQVGGILQFCRRAGIPAEVYLFNSMYNKWAENRFNNDPALAATDPGTKSKRTRQDALRYGIYGTQDSWLVKEAFDFTDHVCHLPSGSAAKGGHVILKAFSLMKVYDAKMDNRKFAATFGRLLLLANTFGSRNGRCEGFKGNLAFGDCLCMGDTPLDESILAMREIVSKFRKSSNTKVSFISMSDGEGQGLTNMYHYTKRGQTRSAEKGVKTVTSVLIDGRNGRRYENGKLDRGCARDKTHGTCVQMFRDATDCEIIGIMMIPGKRHPLNYISMYSTNFPKFENYADGIAKTTADQKKFTEEGYIAIPVEGYNSYFFLAVETERDIAREQEKERKRLETLKNRKVAIERQMILDGSKNQANRAFINRLMEIVA